MDNFEVVVAFGALKPHVFFVKLLAGIQVSNLSPCIRARVLSVLNGLFLQRGHVTG